MLNPISGMYGRKKHINFGKDKMVYLCSPLASGFTPSQECPNMKSFIRSNMAKAIDYAKVIFNNGDMPVWNHSTWPHFVDDEISEERKRAMEGCFALVKRCDALC